MMQSRSREKAMLATVSRLRRLLRNADLATKVVIVMGNRNILHRNCSPGRDGACPVLRREARQAASLRSTLGSSKNFAQFAAQNLARRGSRHGVHEVNFAGLLVVGEAVGDEIAKLFGKSLRWREAFTEHDKSAGNFSGVEVWFGDHATIAHGGMFEQQ